MGIEVEVSVALAFAAGAVSVLSACVLPVLPGYLAYVTGASMANAVGRPAGALRAWAALHATAFMAGFGLVLMTLGLVGTEVGLSTSAALPWIHRLGGVGLVALAIRMWSRKADPDLAGETSRVRPGAWSAAAVAFAVGLTFGAGWTPCIGPVFGSILLYASQESTWIRGNSLLAVYGVGLAVPFVLAAIGVTWPLAGSDVARRSSRAVRRGSAVVLGLVGLAIVTGHFAGLTRFLAGLGQLFNLEL